MRNGVMQATLRPGGLIADQILTLRDVLGRHRGLGVAASLCGHRALARELPGRYAWQMR
ncbi:MAG: hypothetical protein QOJ85_3888 [Solirubrobacteraceae bacterium]|jgi:hypothetical protein|nr:hypothetical protein [Solirubrobacteraceae bacterium]